MAQRARSISTPDRGAQPSRRATHGVGGRTAALLTPLSWSVMPCWVAARLMLISTASPVAAMKETWLAC